MSRSGATTALSTGLSSHGISRVGFIGDSITAGDDGYNPALTGGENNNSPALYAMLAGNGAWELIINAGVGGNTSTQILTRLGTDILANRIDACVLFSCTMNDIGQGLSLAQSLANVTTIITRCLAAGTLPILCTPTPYGQTGSTAATRTAVAERRRLFIELGRKYRVPVVDLFPVLVDPATGNLANAYNADGSVHPNPAGRQLIGQAVQRTLDTLTAGGGVTDIGYAGDSDDLLGGIGFFNGAPTAGIAAGWGNSLAAGATASILNDATLGNMQRITTAGTTGNSYIPVGVSLTPGHTYEISGYISKAGSSMGQLSLACNASRKISLVNSPDIVRGRINIQTVTASSDTGATVYLVAGPGTGTVDFGRVTIRDLTALGI